MKSAKSWIRSKSFHCTVCIWV